MSESLSDAWWGLGGLWRRARCLGRLGADMVGVCLETGLGVGGGE